MEHAELSVKPSTNEKTSRGRDNPDCLLTNTANVLENLDVVTVTTLYSGKQSKPLPTT